MGYKKIKCIRCHKTFESHTVMIKHFKREHPEFMDTAMFKWMIANSEDKTFENVETERDLARKTIAARDYERMIAENKRKGISVPKTEETPETSEVKVEPVVKPVLVKEPKSKRKSPAIEDVENKPSAETKKVRSLLEDTIDSDEAE